MWNRVYVFLLIAAFIVTGFLVYYAGSWLGSIGAPRDAFDGFHYYSRLSGIVMWSSVVVLLAVANVVLWIYGRAWAIWTTLLFAVVFVFARFAWLENSALRFAERNSLPTDGLRWGFLMALITAAAAAGVAYFDVFVVGRLRDRMQPPIASERDPIERPEEIEQPPVEE